MGKELMDTHATTILAVRKNGRVALAGDGQVTLGQNMGDKLERCPKLQVVTVAALLGKTIHNIHTGSSVSVLFV